MPVAALVFNNIATPIELRNAFIKLIQTFNEHGDATINEIFSPLLGDRQFRIPVVITYGVPAPYDAWTAMYQGENAFFFNLSDWDADSINHFGLAVVKHEITHVLLAELLQKPDANNPIDVLNEMVINEGIAHFVGYPHERQILLTEKTKELQKAEQILQTAKVKLGSSKTSKIDVEDLLQRGNTGQYWEKYASIAGMYRAACLYSKYGAKGIVDAIREGALPPP